MVTFPNAKINIGLDILRKRHDGYHDISTVMVPIPWTDILEITPSHRNTDTLSVTGRAVDCPPKKNLVMKAVNAMRDIATFGHVDIYLHKIIPDGAGLGGGSADATYTLLMLNDMFDLCLTHKTLVSLASSLGADCPFFIYNRPMLCEGTGVDMTEIEIAWPATLILAVVKPSVSVPTKDAYASVSPSVPQTGLHERLSQHSIKEWLGSVKNDFEPSVFSTHPIIGDIKSWLLQERAIYASMSGSGSAVYGLFDCNDTECDILAEHLRNRFDGYDILVKPMDTLPNGNNSQKAAKHTV